jgi:hypothetical protein
VKSDGEIRERGEFQDVFPREFLGPLQRVITLFVVLSIRFLSEREVRGGSNGRKRERLISTESSRNLEITSKRSFSHHLTESPLLPWKRTSSMISSVTPQWIAAWKHLRASMTTAITLSSKATRRRRRTPKSFIPSGRGEGEGEGEGEGSGSGSPTDEREKPNGRGMRRERNSAIVIENKNSCRKREEKEEKKKKKKQNMRKKSTQISSTRNTMHTSMCGEEWDSVGLTVTGMNPVTAC